jgi:DNA-binding transcriptional MerR regulator
MSIGEVAAVTGVPAETLRTWERRYGFPAPERSEGGHRLYSRAAVSRLRQAVRAIDMGYRPGAVLQMGEEELSGLVRDALALLERVGAADRDAPPEPFELVGLWGEYARAYDVSALERSFERAWYTHGVEEFLATYTTRLEFEVAEQVRQGSMEARHAGFLMGRMRGFLDTHLRGAVCRSQGPLVLCVTSELVDDLGVGYHAAAVLMALSGCKVLTLAPGREVGDVSRVAEDLAGELAAVYVHADEGGRHEETLGVLRGVVPATCALLVGGAHGRELEGVLRMKHLDELKRWAPNLFIRASP